MKNFPEWFAELKSDEIWYNQICFMYSKKNMKLVAQQCYADLLAQPERFKKADLTDFRKCYHAWLKNSKDDYQAPQLQQEEVKKEDNWKPASPEHVDKCVAEFDEMLKNSPMVNGMPKLTAKELIENGNWRAQKLDPRSDVQKAMIITDHIERIRLARRKTFLQYFPDAKEEEIQAYLTKFESIGIEP